MAGCGIDFGTTNSVVSCVIGGQARPLLDDQGRPHPSVIWFHGEQVKVGRTARAMLDSNAIGVAGDFLRSPKSMLGTGQPAYVGGRIVRPMEAAALVFKHLRAHAGGMGLKAVDLDRAVVTIPVDMRGSARRELREAAGQAGIEIEQFVHEPFAALYGYARQQVDPEQVLDRLLGRLALVFDWGGGTLDLTLCERVGNMLVQVQSVGNSAIGGDKFDERLVHFAVSRHMQRHGWTQPGEMVPGQRAKLLASCEQAKISLSQSPSATVLVKGLFVGSGPAADLVVEISLAEFQAAVQDLVDAGLGEIDRLLESAGQSPQSVELCLPTGGVVAMPVIKERLLKWFGPSRCDFPERADTLIADGAAWIASADVPLTLAKNIEFRHADHTWVPLVQSGRKLPRGGESSDPVPFTLFCADPRNGVASIELGRPKRSSRLQAADPRQCYGLLQVEVRRDAPPLREPIALRLTIDPDLIVHVKASGGATGREARAEIHELEFGIGLGQDPESPPDGEGNVGERRQPGRGFQATVTRVVGEFVTAQRNAHASAWVPLDDLFQVGPGQESLNRAVSRLFIEEYGRVPDSVITLLLGMGIPCVRYGGRWVASNPGQATRPDAPQAAAVGPAASVVLRANVTQREDDLHLIPGDLVDRHHPGFTGSARVTPQQLDEIRWARARNR